MVVVNSSGGLVINGAAGSVNVNLLDSVHGGAPFATPGTYDLFQFSGAIGGTGLSALLDANVPFGTQATFGTAVVGGNQFVTVTLAPNSTPVPTWNQAGGGSWTGATNWTPNGVPSGQGQTAVLGSSIAAPSTVTLDGVQTVGTIAFNNSNSYTVAAGTGGSLVLDNGTGAAHLVGSSGSHTISAPVTLNSNLAASITAGSVTLSGVVTDGGAGKSISLSGAGTLVLSNANTYSGGTSLLSGTVQVGSNTSLGTGGVNFAASATLQAGANATLANNISVAPSTTATIDTQANTLGLSGIVSSTDNTATFNKIGAGTLVVTGVNTFTGTVAVNGGTLQLGNGVTNGSFSAASITTVNSTLAFNTVGAVTVANNITGSGGLAQNGTNTITLTGTNTFTGGLTINSGNVSLGTSQTVDTAGTGTITIGNGGMLVLTGYNASTTPTYATVSNKIVIPNGANATIEGQPRATFAGAVTGNGTLNYGVQYVRGAITGDWSAFHGQVNLFIPTGSINAGGDFRINTATFNASGASVNVGPGVNVYTLITNGTVALGDLTGNGTLMTSDSNLGILAVGATETAGQTTTFTGSIGEGARSTSITKNGPGTLDLAGSNVVTGTLTVNQGTLTFLGATATPATTNGLSVAAGATLDVANWNPTILQGTIMTPIGITGNGTIGSSSTSAPSTITFNGNTVSNGTVTGTITSTFAGSIVDSVNGGTQKVSLNVANGTLALSGTNTFTGGTTISGGTLRLGAGGTTGSIVSTPTTTIPDNGVLAFNRSDNVAFGAIISGTGGVTQVGPGVLTLSGGTSTYSGGTTLNAGAIYATNTTGSATGSGAVLLNGGTLGGTGFLGGTITAGSGPHTISPGANTPNAIGTLTAGGLSTNANTTLMVDLVAPGGTNDLLAITGNVSLAGGNVTLGANPLSGAASLGYYKIMTYTGTLSGAGMTVAATSTDPNVVYTLDTSTIGVINVHKGFIGDANDDGTVDLTDLSIVLNNFGSSTTSWTLGNFDGASSIDLTDLSDVLNKFGSTVASTASSTGSALAATPEPASLAIAVPAAMMLLRRRRTGSR